MKIVAVFLDMCENYGRNMEVEIPMDRRIVKGILKNSYIRYPDVYVVLYNCEVKKNGKVTKYHKVRIPLLTKFCKYRFL